MTGPENPRPRRQTELYRAHGVQEVLEVDVVTGRARLLVGPDVAAGPAEQWSEVPASRAVPGLEVVAGAVVADGQRYG